MQQQQVIERDPLDKKINPQLSRHYGLMNQYLTDDEIRFYLTIPGYEQKPDHPKGRRFLSDGKPT